SITNYGGIPSGSYPEVCVMGICQGNIKNLNRNLKRNERLRRTSSCTLTPKAPAFLPSTHCGVYGASADSLLLWVQVMS
ncbi:MAG: hypothetical protein L6406_03420, partial [Desulfobacterales bacterium]|nr:hypothetical protein [Desulfobacterales bacterium]